MTQNVKKIFDLWNNIIYYKKIAENCLRHIINEYDGIIPTILEIPAKEYAYEAKKVIILVWVKYFIF